MYDENGSAFGMIFNGTPYYYVKNLQGDVLRVVNADGTVVASYSYDAWGRILSSSGTLASINPIRYRSYYYDYETGFYYLQSRYYDPEICRFINADDTALIGANGNFLSYNLFTYCGNNPVVREDAEGGFWITAVCIGFGAGFIAQYVSDVISNVKKGVTGTKVFTETSSMLNYVASGVGGAIAAIPGLNLVGTLAVGAVGNVVSDVIKGNINSVRDFTESAFRGAIANGVGYGFSKVMSAIKVKQIGNMSRSTRKIFLRDNFYSNSQVNVNQNLRTFANSPFATNMNIVERQMPFFRSGIYSTMTSTTWATIWGEVR